jgi:hypothetical protein
MEKGFELLAALKFQMSQVFPQRFDVTWGDLKPYRGPPMGESIFWWIWCFCLSAIAEDYITCQSRSLPPRKETEEKKKGQQKRARAFLSHVVEGKRTSELQDDRFCPSMGKTKRTEGFNVS